MDLSAFRIWYEPGGDAAGEGVDAHEGRTARIRIEQATPPTPGQGQGADADPAAVALFGAATGPSMTRALILLDAAEEQMIEGVEERPVLSINRGFSAPVVVESDRGSADLAFLSAHDDDPFARYEAMQQLMVDTLSRRSTARRDDRAGGRSDAQHARR